ncbi:copper resistance protein CopC [Nocardioides sp. BP30]|uniref:copper resistance CopC/CopD family protein n=1 Tax=Nocardioides sp. BP30 TaxID=3036374 RepID=UPI0024691949|nr:copper resistance protein CopC [Nocardioides sp. BP30]WGL51273.1 copper resistance protein CopC [Nocardioides sp. BP30]
MSRVLEPRGRWVRFAAALGALVVLAVMAAAAPASAHAVLEGSTPPPDVVLATAPDSVSLSFDEAVTLLPTSLRVYGPDGARVDAGDVAHPAGKGQAVSVHLRSGGAQGTYLVSWRVISADSHPVSGAYTFSVGRTSAAPVAPDDATNKGVAVALGAARLVGYAGSALLVGTLLFVAWCWAEGWSLRRVRRLAAVGAGLLALGTVADVLLKGPYDAALGFGSLGQGRLLREVLGTTYGHAAIARLVLVAALTLTLRLSRLPRLPVGVGAVLVGVSFALSGHAAAGSGRVVAALNDTVHVLCASMWLGSLAVILVAVLPLAENAAAVVARFSALAAVLVLLIVASGTYQAVRQVGSWAALGGTTYGRELLVKIGVVAVVLVAAAGSRAWVRQQRRTAGSTRILRRAVLAEAAGLVVVLGISSALVATEPAKTAYHPSIAANLVLEGDTVQVSAVPTGDRRMELHLYIFGKDQLPTDPKEIDATLSLPARSVGPLPVTLVNAGTGHRQGSIAVPVSGTWRLSVTLRTTAVDEATGSVALPIK